jgi:hypothetical protein
MRISSINTAATWLFPNQITRMKNILAALDVKITVEEQSFKQIVTFELPEGSDNADIFGLGQLVGQLSVRP